MPEPVRRAIIPRATYRVQLNAGYTLGDLTDIVPYLAALGISHVYCSPYFRARPGSLHGYDVVDHNALNAEIGSVEDLDRLVATLRAHGMGQLLDIVPNHVGVMGADNAWWLDVLENGQASRFAAFFDIDWQPPSPTLAGKLLIPVLGDSYGETLERGELVLRFDAAAGAFSISYHEHRFPIDPRSYPRVLERTIAVLGAESIAPDVRADLERLIGDFRGLPARDNASPTEAEHRDLAKEACKQRLAGLAQATAPLARAIEVAVASFAGHPGNAPTFDSLHELLEQQAFRLASWRLASDDINYRRFFDGNDLAALRIENEAVFEATSRLARDLVRSGKVDGLRIDHPDGLFDPAGYFRRLQECAGATTADLDARPRRLPLYLLVEKITAGFERLPGHWCVHGTTGYQFANVVNGLFVDNRAKGAIDRSYRAFIGDYLDWPEVAYESKSLILRNSLASELNVLANQLARIAAADRRTRDYTLNSLRSALTEIIACFPVYRTYVGDQTSADDRRYIEWAVGRVRRRSAAANGALLEFVNAALLADGGRFAEPLLTKVLTFAMRFQQVTAPVTAKGIEDTALYRFTRLVSLNDVGGDPEAFGTSVRHFHTNCRHRARAWPHEMLTTSTHDTKRSEDVRARINVLSEVPGRWRRALQRWSRMNRGRRRLVDGLPAPGPHAEYLLYQTLLGTWPLGALDDEAFAAYRDRIADYMVKAMREAKRRTSWLNVNGEYEDVLRQFLRAALERRDGNLFFSEIDEFARAIAKPGFLNSLAATLCKLTAPGVPDIYQGNELWDFSLVDPDNRRAVDYSMRQQELATMTGAVGESPGQQGPGYLESIEDGRVKLYVTWRALKFRRSREALFRLGAYLPLRVRGQHRAHVCAFARKHEDAFAITVVPRLCARLAGERWSLPLGSAVWRDTAIELPASFSADSIDAVLVPGRVAVVTVNGARLLRAADIFAQFPVALLSN